MSDGIDREARHDRHTRILLAVERGEPFKVDEILPLVYDELRRLAAQKLRSEDPALTLQATALVHEAFMRLVDVDNVQSWRTRGHFFAAEAEAMRRILIEHARRKHARKRGGQLERVPFDSVEIEDSLQCPEPEELLALDAALDKLATKDPKKAELVKLRFFAGLSMPKIAEILGLSLATAERSRAFCRAWLRVEITGRHEAEPGWKDSLEKG